MEQEKVFLFRIMVQDILVINVDQFAACVLILAGCGSDKIFDRLLPAVRKPQECLVRGQPSVYVDPLIVIEVKMNIVLLQFVLQIGDVKLVSIKVYQIAVRFGK